jgi:acetyltransferase-like isoleucine patch superfamily enzyme
MNIEFESGVSRYAYIYPNVHIGKNVTVLPGTILGRPPLSTGAARKIDWENLPPLIIEDDCIIGSNCVIYTGSTIGRGSMICDTACIREKVTIGEYSLIAMGVTINCNTTIGSFVKIMDNTHITGNAIIENEVFIGMLVTTANDNAMGKDMQKMENMLGPRIRSGATIGQGACILPGIEIGKSARVGANSVVTQDVPAGITVMGVPARKCP